MHERLSEQLAAFVDEDLSGELQQKLVRHLDECLPCQAEVARLRRLKADAAALPRSIDPPLDLWPGIAGALGGGRRRRPMVSLRTLAAAAALLIVASSTIVYFAARGGEETVMLPLRYRQAEARYVRAASELEEALDAARGALAPETVRLVERNLRIIDAAIEESRAALAKEPADADLWTSLSDRHRNKLSLLQQISRLTART